MTRSSDHQHPLPPAGRQVISRQPVGPIISSRSAVVVAKARDVCQQVGDEGPAAVRVRDG